MAIFGLRSVLGSASNEWACSGFQTKQSEICRATHIHCQRQKCGAGTLVSGDISFMGLGFPEELLHLCNRPWSTRIIFFFGL